jgi:hypothetical protein
MDNDDNDEPSRSISESEISNLIILLNADQLTLWKTRKTPTLVFITSESTVLRSRYQLAE